MATRKDKRVLSATQPRLRPARRAKGGASSRVVAAKPRRGKSGAFLVVALAVLVALCVGGYFLLSGYAKHHDEFVALVSGAVDVIETTDDSLTRMNEMLADPSSVDSSVDITETLRMLEDDKEVLSRAYLKLARIEKAAQTPSEKETVARLSKDLAGRQEMVETGEEALERLSSAYIALACLNEIWAEIDASDAAIRDVSALLSSNEAWDEVVSALSFADERLSAAAGKAGAVVDAFPRADTAPLANYIECERAAIQKELEAMRFLIEGDTASARASQAEYDGLEARACQALDAVGGRLSSVKEAYQAEVSSIAARYKEARTEVALSDGYLRDFLGRVSK